jgi:hypothetical protein
LNTSANFTPASSTNALQASIFRFRDSFIGANGTYNKRFKSSTAVSESRPNPFNLPIVQSFAVIPIAATTLIQSGYGALPTFNDLVLTLTAYSEWQLLFTTLRIVLHSVTT